MIALIICKTFQSTPDRAFVFVEFYRCFKYGLALAESSCLYLRMYPEVDFAVEENFGGNETGFIEFGEDTVVEKGVGEFDVH